jgi:hypothetical protein
MRKKTEEKKQRAKRKWLDGIIVSRAESGRAVLPLIPLLFPSKTQSDDL